MPLAANTMIDINNYTLQLIQLTLQEPHQKSSQFSSSDFVAMTSAFIALLALFATIYTSLIQRKHNRLSSKPLLNIVLNSAEKKLSIANSGLGPAIIKEVEAILDGRIYNLLIESDADSFAEAACAGLRTDTYYAWMALDQDAVIAAGSSELMLWVKTDQRDEWNLTYGALDRTALKVVYQSIYKESSTCTHLGQNHYSAHPKPPES